MNMLAAGKHWVRCVWLAGIAAVLSACSSGTVGFFVGPDDGTGTTPTANALRVNVSSTTLRSDATTSDLGVTITAFAVDANNNAVEGVPVQFFASSGSLQVTQATTNDAGVATAILTTGGDDTLRNILVSALAGSVVSTPTTTTIQVVPPSSGTQTSATALTMVLSSNTLRSDGTTDALGVTISVFATDANNNAVDGVPVQFLASSGSIKVTQATTVGGVATAILTTGGNATLRTIQVQAKSGSLQTGTQAVSVVNPPSTTITALRLVANRPTLSADADEPDDTGVVTITAYAVDANNRGVANVPVSFSTDTGLLHVTTATTDPTGAVQAVLTTGGNPTVRTINVTATTGSIVGGPIPIQVVAPETTTASTLILLASAPTLPSGASATTTGVTLTAIVKDVNNNVLPNEVVTFSTSDSAELVVDNPALTDDTGRVTATLNTGGDPRNRTITIRAASGALSETIDIQVIGTRLAISGPANIPSGTSTAYTVTLVDSEDRGISGATVTVSATTGSLVPTSLTTDSNGQATTSFTPSAATSVLNASGLGVTAASLTVNAADEFEFILPAADGTEVDIGTSQTITVRWLRNSLPVAGTINFTATRGTLSAPSMVTDGAGEATVTIDSAQAGFSTIVATGSGSSTTPTVQRSIEFIAVTPASIVLQASPAVVAVNQTSAITATVRDAAQNLVKNQTIDFSLDDPSSGTLSAPSAVTNSQGQATVQYQASSQSSANDGVIITGTVRDFPLVPSDDALVTVGAKALDISIGTGAEIVSKDLATYQMPFSVTVTDSAGNPAPGATFTLSVRPLIYYKGYRTGLTAPPCDNEDVDYDGILDAGEDFNGNGALDPGNVPTVPATVALDTSGSGQFFLTYPKNFGQFLTVQIIGVATVAGTSGTEIRAITLAIDADEEENLPQESPYGVAATCGDPD